MQGFYVSSNLLLVHICGRATRIAYCEATIFQKIITIVLLIQSLSIATGQLTYSQSGYSLYTRMPVGTKPTDWNWADGTNGSSGYVQITGDIATYNPSGVFHVADSGKQRFYVWNQATTSWYTFDITWSWSNVDLCWIEVEVVAGSTPTVTRIYGNASTSQINNGSFAYVHLSGSGATTQPSEIQPTTQPSDVEIPDDLNPDMTKPKEVFGELIRDKSHDGYSGQKVFHNTSILAIKDMFKGVLTNGNWSQFPSHLFQFVGDGDGWAFKDNNNFLPSGLRNLDLSQVVYTFHANITNAVNNTPTIIREIIFYGCMILITIAAISYLFWLYNKVVL